MSGIALSDTVGTPPRSEGYMSKEIVKENFTIIKGTTYYKRVFIDGSVELARYDYNAARWVFLLFKE